MVEPTRQLLRPGQSRKVRENNSDEFTQELLIEKRNNTGNPMELPEESSDNLDRSVEPQSNVDISMGNEIRENIVSSRNNRDFENLGQSEAHRQRVPIDASCPMETDEHVRTDSEATNSRPQRERRRPAYLREYDVGEPLAHSLSCTTVRQTFSDPTSSTKLTDSQHFGTMAQQQLINPEPVLDILEEGELLEPQEPRLTLSGASVDNVEVSNGTIDKIAELFDQLLLEGKCDKRKCDYISANRERQKIHAESHYLIYLAPCSFFSSCRDSVRRHQKKQHEGSTTAITIVDRRNWKRIQATREGLPVNWPKCPVASKDFCACQPSKPPKVKVIPTYVRKMTDPMRLSIKKTGDFRTARQPREQKRPRDTAQAVPDKRRKLSADLDGLESHISRLQDLLSYLQHQAAETLAQLRKMD